MKIKNKKGFTLIEVLVVVLIIGILAAVALPQYRIAVAKSKIASMLPIMRAWKDAYTEYSLRHDEYLDENYNEPDADTLGVNWPSDWECDNEQKTVCHNDEWDCYANNESEAGETVCYYKHILRIAMYQYDDQVTCEGISFANKITCEEIDNSILGKNICKNMGHPIEGCTYGYEIGG